MSDFTIQQARNRIDATIGTNGSGNITGKTLNEAFNGVLDAMNTLYTRQVGDNWYGIIWSFDTNGTSTVTRIGNPMLHASLPVQSLMKGCVLNLDGSVNYYLNPTDWAYKADGTTPSVLTGADGDVMVEVPAFYYKYDELYNGFIKRLMISLYKVDETWSYSPKFYVGAYKGYISSSKLLSVTGQKATVSTSLPNFRTAARAKVSNNTNWNVITYSIRKAIWMLFVTEYATLNSQEDFSSQLTTDGFHKGGLGLGVTQGTVGGAYNLCTTGYTNAQGNFSIGSESFSDGGSNQKCRYRGIENPFGEVWEWTDGVFIENYVAYEIVDKGNFTKLGNSSYTGDVSSECRLIGNVNQTASGYSIKTILGGSHCDILASDVNTSDTGGATYYRDGWWINSGFRGVLFGGSADNGAQAGLAYADAYLAPSGANANIGSRLAYIVE